VLRIHDTMANRTVEFVPRTPGRISMYVCGPTVYDVPHLGHGRSALVFDTIRRYLTWSGFEVTYASNVTDVEDKIIARAAREGGTEPEIAARFTEAYWDELDRLGIHRPDAAPHATEFIDGMQALIAELVESGHAYVIEGEGVYFEVGSFADYGALSHRKVEDLIESAGARVDVEERKRSPVDFALWKAAKEGEPAWDSPWGRGRPGWHIECSAMSLSVLGEGFDIHGGGDDLLFPHHENEIAQAEAAGHSFARHWLHNGMVMVGKEKMSKSVGNFTNLSDALNAYGSRAFRLATLRAQYRSQVELGDEVLADAARAVQRLDALTRRARGVGLVPTDVLDEATVEKFRTAMDDDFATPSAVAAIFEAAADANRALDAGSTNRAAILVTTVRELIGVLGIELEAGGGDGQGDAEIDALVAEREHARANKDFGRADEVRDELARRGVTVEDTATGSIWHR
jgi:cysteinyl-tRNA synthetase